MKRHQWSITGGTFRPSIASNSDVGPIIVTSMSNADLISNIILNYKNRSPRQLTDGDFLWNDYGDEVDLQVRSGGRWRTFLNLQYEGEFLG